MLVHNFSYKATDKVISGELVHAHICIKSQYVHAVLYTGYKLHY